jgi:hypothetical protein
MVTIVVKYGGDPVRRPIPLPDRLPFTRNCCHCVNTIRSIFPTLRAAF